MFADGALRSDEWGGFIWLYLPSRLPASVMQAHAVSKSINIFGTSWHKRGDSIEGFRIADIFYIIFFIEFIVRYFNPPCE